jgi:hypothetical protein
MEKSFNEKLNEWAEKAATQCYEIATSEDAAQRVDKCFYAFQSPPPAGPNPALLIMGANPREDGGEDYAYSTCGSKNLRQDIEAMKRGNKYWDGRNTWAIWNTLKYYFEPAGLREMLESSVFINLVYFNSQDVKTLKSSFPGGANAIRVCQNLTGELVFDIIRPKYVLCLGTSDCFDRVEGTDEQVYQSNERGTRLFVKKTSHGIPVYGIPHPTGAHGISNENRAAIRQFLLEELLKKE